MIFYLSLFMISSFFAFIYSNSKEYNVSVVAKISYFLIVFFPAAFRVNIGTDYLNYTKVFYLIQNNEKVRAEVGWVLLNKICIILGMDVQWIFIISAFFTIYFIFKTPKKDFFIVFVSFFCLFYLDSYNIVRQCLAMSMCWYSYLLLEKNKKLKAFFYSITSIFFHSSLIIFVLFELMICFIKINNTKIVYVILLCCFIASYINLPIKFLSIILAHTRYGVYFTQFDYYNNRSSGLGSLFSLLVRLLIILSMYYFIIKYNKIEKKELSNIAFFVLAIAIMDVFSASIFMLQRVKMIFYLSYMFIMKYLFSTNGLLYKWRNGFFLLYIILYFLIIKLITGANAIIPYQYSIL